MARVRVLAPSSCPLRRGHGPHLGLDHCTRCGRRVHNLDGMSPTQRRAFFAPCTESSASEVTDFAGAAPAAP